jgi:hypothetical protein
MPELDNAGQEEEKTYLTDEQLARTFKLYGVN